MKKIIWKSVRTNSDIPFFWHSENPDHAGIRNNTKSVLNDFIDKIKIAGKMSEDKNSYIMIWWFESDETAAEFKRKCEEVNPDADAIKSEYFKQNGHELLSFIYDESGKIVIETKKIF